MVGKNIAKLRNKLGLTQVQFAARLNVTQGAVSQWETGRTMPDTFQLLSIAKALDIPVDALTSGEDVPVVFLQKEEPTYNSEAENIRVQILRELESLPDSAFESAMEYIRFLKANSKEGAPK